MQTAGLGQVGRVHGNHATRGWPMKLKSSKFKMVKKSALCTEAACGAHNPEIALRPEAL